MVDNKGTVPQNELMLLFLCHNCLPHHGPARPTSMGLADLTVLASSQKSSQSWYMFERQKIRLPDVTTKMRLYFWSVKNVPDPTGPSEPAAQALQNFILSDSPLVRGSLAH